MERQYNIATVKVPFNREPFPQQLALMNKLIQALRKGENGLLESPTGTGKTLAILSSALAWQKFEFNRQVEIRNKIEQVNHEIKNENKTSKYFKEVEDDVDDDDFVEERKIKFKQVEEEENVAIKKRKLFTIRKETIFFASRTHSQLKQMVKELKGLPAELLDGINMTVLASRKSYCVNPKVTRKFDTSSGRNDECKRLAVLSAKGKGCKFNSNSTGKLGGYSGRILDIEDLVEKATERTQCPYYIARQMVQRGGANVIFCPYNYLMSPSTRNAMGLDSKIQGSVVIIDEAHNIEDVARDAASCELSLSRVIKLRSEIQVFEKHQALVSFVSSFTGWYEGLCQESTVVLGGPESVVLLHENTGLSTEMLDTLTTSLKSKDDEEEGLPPSIVSVLDELFGVFNFILSDGGVHARDFKVVVRPNGKGDHQLCFWCLNAAVAFKALADCCRSIVLASGTLAPLNSFAHELGVAFNHKLEAPHVVNVQQQVFSRVVAYENRVKLEATFSNQKSEEYVDALGRCMLKYCKEIPDGTLCFFPSYSFMNSCLNLWKKGDIWKSLNDVKTVFVEGEEPNLDIQMQKYLEAVAQKGALFFCVFRGKLAEGIDFKDTAARAVMICGIPYPNIGDMRIKLKMEWQASNCQSGDAMNGRTWYNLQAFRALNQALGRCIRHREDYGTILFLDHRFQQENVLKSISKWVRPAVQAVKSSKITMGELRTFFERNATRENEVRLTRVQKKESRRPGIIPPLATLFNNDHYFKCHKSQLEKDVQEISELIYSKSQNYSPGLKQEEFFSSLSTRMDSLRK